MGPCLFLAYINDLPDKLKATSRLFADDTAVYSIISGEADRAQLQEDLNHLSEWEESWDMLFHPAKCVALPITRSRTPYDSSYYLHGHKLETVSSAKYLGVTITSKLDWDDHVTAIINKSNKTLGFLRRNLKIGSSKIKEKAYKTFIRPLLEYSATVWDPYTQKNKDRLEAVQRRAARFVLNRYHNTSSVTRMLETLQWPKLESRRKNARLLMLFKSKHQLVQCPIIRSKLIAAPTRQRRCHAQQLQLITTRTKYREGSFLPRTIKDWNALPSGVVAASTAKTFGFRLAH